MSKAEREAGCESSPFVTGDDKGLPSGNGGRMWDFVFFREASGSHLNKSVGYGGTWEKERETEKERVEPAV